jgi:hypothetical protein
MKRKRLQERIKGGSRKINVSDETYELINELRALLERKTGAEEISAHYVIKYSVKRVLEEEKSQDP